MGILKYQSPIKLGEPPDKYREPLPDTNTERNIKMKIRLTKDLPWAKAGEEFEVNGLENAQYIEISRQGHNECEVFYLSELEGWYEVVKWRPKEGQEYFIIHGDGEIHKLTCHYLSNYIKVGNCFPIREEAEEAAEKLKTIFKTEI